MPRKQHAKQATAKKQQGHENLTKPYIQGYINQKISMIFDKLGNTQEKVIQELAKVAFRNVGDCLQGDWELKDLSDINPETATAINRIRITKNGYHVTKHDKVSA
jgi:phage terminase small subunit